MRVGATDGSASHGSNAKSIHTNSNKTSLISPLPSLTKQNSGKEIPELVPAASPLPALPTLALRAAAPGLAPGYAPPAGYKLVSAVSAAPDFPSLLSAGGRAYLVNHFE